MSRRKLTVLALVAGALSMLVFGGAAAAKKPPKKPHKPKKQHVAKKQPKPLTPLGKLARVKHIVVIYEENHSFDNLYGGWEGVRGLSTAPAEKKTQVNEGGGLYTSLMQTDATPPALPATCTDSTTGTTFTSHFLNAPFTIDDFIKPADTTCPPTPN